MERRIKYCLLMQLRMITGSSIIQGSRASCLQVEWSHQPFALHMQQLHHNPAPYPAFIREYRTLLGVPSLCPISCNVSTVLVVRSLVFRS